MHNKNHKTNWKILYTQLFYPSRHIKLYKLKCANPLVPKKLRHERIALFTMFCDFQQEHIQQLQLWWMEKKPRLTNLMDIRKCVMNSCKSQKTPQCHLVKQIFCPQLDNTSQRGKGSNQLKHIYISLSYDIINPTFILGKMMIFVWHLKLFAKKTINMETAQEK